MGGKTFLPITAGNELEKQEVIIYASWKSKQNTRANHLWTGYSRSVAPNLRPQPKSGSNGGGGQCLPFLPTGLPQHMVHTALTTIAPCDPSPGSAGTARHEWVVSRGRGRDPDLGSQQTKIGSHYPRWTKLTGTLISHGSREAVPLTPLVSPPFACLIHLSFKY